MPFSRPARPLTHRGVTRGAVLAVALATVAPLTGLSSATAASSSGRAHLNAHRSTAHLPANVKTDKLDPSLLAKAKSGRVNVMLELDAAPASKAYRVGLAQGGHTAARTDSRAAVSRIHIQQAAVRSHFSQSATRATEMYAVHAVYSGIAVTTDRSHLAALAAIPGVKAIHAMVEKHVSLTNTVPLIKAPQAWDSHAGTGKGVKIGVIDTGTDYTHADFGGDGTVAAYDAAKATDALPPSHTGGADLGGFGGSKVVGGYDFAGDNYNPDSTDPAAAPAPDPNPLDCNSHGTHTSGIAAGLGVTTGNQTYLGDYSSATDFSQFHIGPGVAPGASLYALKVFGCAGGTLLVGEALDWAADPNGDGDLSDHLDVINMSLGADFTSPQDSDATASNNAVALGIVIAASAGNDNNLYDVGGSPGSATRVIDVAATEDGAAVTDGLKVDAPASIAGNYPALESVAYDWATKPGVTNIPVIRTNGDWSQPPSSTNNTDGCGGTPALPDATGKILLMQWHDANDGARRCGSVGHSAAAKGAGAIGVILGSDVNNFSAGITGDAVIPVMLTVKDARDKLLSEVDNGTVFATLTHALHNQMSLNDPSLADQIADFSSRGVGADGNLKPDVAAPGATVFSAGMGEGTDGLTDSGTSMAAPHVAGVAALVRAAHPGWTPEQVKAAIMNTATQDVSTDPAHGGPVQTPMRVGAGRVNAQQAVNTQTLAYNADNPGAVSVSFGPVDATKKVTLTRKVHIVNTRPTSAATYAVSYRGLDDNPGATYSASTDGVSVPALGSVDITVSLTVDPTKLTDHQDPSRNGVDGATGFQTNFVNEAAGLLVLSPTGATSGSDLRVPLYSAPTPASTMTQPSTVTLGGSGPVKSGTMTLTGQGVAQGGAADISPFFSTVDAFELQGASPRQADCSGTVTSNCVLFPDNRAADVKYVGVASDAPAATAAGLTTPELFDPNNGVLLHLGIASWGPFTAPASNVFQHVIGIDVTGDGVPDAITYNTRLSGGPDRDTDVMVAETDAYPSGDTLDIEVLNNTDGTFDTHIYNSDVLTMPVSLAALADAGLDTANPRISYFVDSFDQVGGFSNVQDTVGDPDAGQSLMSVNVVNPAVQSGDDFGQVLLDDQPGSTLPVSLDTAQLAADKPLGVLMLHHDNVTGDRAQVVALRQAVKVTLTSAKNPAPYGYHVPVTVKVADTNAAAATKPTGTVTIKDGTKALVSKALTSGSATLSLPVLGVGKHALTAVYSGNGTYAAGGSPALTETITKAATTTTLSSSTAAPKAGKAITLTAVTKVVSPGASPVKGTVTFFDNGKKFATVATTGTAKVNRTLTKGAHTLTATYGGSSTTGASTGSKKLTAS